MVLPQELRTGAALPFDGPGHDGRGDAQRMQALGLPTLRYKEHEVDTMNFMRRLIQDCVDLASGHRVKNAA